MVSEHNFTVTTMLSDCKSVVVLPVVFAKPVQSSKSTPVLCARSTASTTSVANEPSYVSSWSTDDTLSMITTPWTTESWTTNDVEDFWTQCDLTSLSATPKTSSSYGISTVFNSFSKTTLTIYSFQEFDTKSESIHPLEYTASGSSSTFSSWTVESFTSCGWFSDVSSDFVKANYPWSPFTEMSYTDTYPSSMASNTHSFPSTITVNTGFPSLEVTNEDTILVS